MDMCDAVTDAEGVFPIENLLQCAYFEKYRRAYCRSREEHLLNPYRNYVTLLNALTDIHEYNERHARSFARRFREGAGDFRNCEAVFAEVIVYRHYIGAVHESLVRRIHLHESEADVIIERLDGARVFLEVFSVNPNFPSGTADKSVANEVKTHTQDAMASIRQKLLRKMAKQKQMTAPRENYAVIELNDMSIAGDFAVLASLSGGYKAQLDADTLRPVRAGYDWESSVFDDPATRFLKGIVWFDRGDYASRRFLPNPRAKHLGPTPSWPGPFDLKTFLNHPEPKIFDRDKIITADEPFDVREFVRAVHEGRDVRRKEFLK